MKTIALFLSLLILTPQPKANAGLVLIVGGSIADTSGEGNWATMSGFTGMLFGVMIAGGGYGAGSAWVTVTGAAMVALDEKPSLSQSTLEIILSDKYPFIDNEQVIKNLAKNVLIKAQPVQENILLAKFTESEISELLSPANLTDEDLAIVVSDFQ